MWLQKHTQNGPRAIKQFTSGGFIFAAGMMAIIFADKLIISSLEQELVALGGLILVITGAALALWGYLSMSLFKILIHLLKRRT
ncbi:hypothetical protein [Reinekea marinisedimentorum]|uniref:hypothetical protein n=1 Tax=Reinekea marinisedimentorum TaxID=230495 RepID=UPI001045DE77|nr:hypothetical protein [Reinekea marinisedimentorum]